MNGRAPRGLSLAEIVVAIGVASIAVMSLAVFVSTIYRAVHEGKSRAAAATVARRVIERLRSDREYFQSVRTAPGEYTEDQLFWEADDVLPVRYHVEARVVDLAGAPAGYFDASVTVWWDEERRRREVTLETYLPQP